MSGRWKAFWGRLFGSSRGWGRRDKVLEYVAHRVDDGAPVLEVVREEYVRRMATEDEIERIISDPRILEGVRERVRRDLEFDGVATRRPP